MSKTDSSREEGEISDEDDITPGTGNFGADGGVPPLPAPHTYSNKIGRNKKIHQGRQQNNKPNNYRKKKFHSAQVYEDDYQRMISEYKNIRRLAKHQHPIETEENVNFIKSSVGHQQESEDHELMLLRKSALESEKTNSNFKFNDVNNIAATLNQNSDSVDNYDIVHMDVESDTDDVTATGISANITMLEEHISQLKQKKLEITECQKQLMHHQSMLSDVSELPAMVDLDQQPLYSIICHNLLTSGSARPPTPLDCPNSLGHLQQGTRGPLLPNPRGPLLPKPGLLPVPKIYPQCTPPVVGPGSVDAFLQAVPGRPLVELSNFQTIVQEDLPDHSDFSPRPIEVVGGSNWRDSQTLSSSRHSPLMSNNFHGSSSSSSMASLSLASIRDERIGHIINYCHGMNLNEKAKDPLYEDFDDELNASRNSRHGANRSYVPSTRATPSSVLPFPSASWIQPVPYCENPVAQFSNHHDYFEQDDDDFKDIKFENDEKTKDIDSYISTLKSKLLQDIEFKKSKKSSQMECPQSSDKITSARRASIGEEEDFCDMIVIDSDHDDSLTAPDGLEREVKPIKTNKADLPVAVEDTSSDANDDTKDEELILRARLLQSLAARQIKQVGNQVQSGVQDDDDDDDDIVEKLPVIEAPGIQNSEKDLQKPLWKKKKKNRRRRVKKNNIVNIVAPASSRRVTLPSKMSPSHWQLQRSNSANLRVVPSPSIRRTPVDRPLVDHSFRPVEESSAGAQTAKCNSPRTFSSAATGNTTTYAEKPDVDRTHTISGQKSGTTSGAEVKHSSSSSSVRIESSNSGGVKFPPTTRTTMMTTRSGPTQGGGLSVTNKYPKVPPIKTKVNPMFPNWEPIVIFLSGDESEDSEMELKEENPLDDSISNKIESLLKEARKEMALSSANQSASNAATHSKVTSVPLTSLENNGSKCNEDKMDGMNEVSNASRNTQLTRKDKLENLNKEELKRREKELEVSLLTHKLSQLEKKSVMESKSLKEQKVLLLKFESVLSKKRAELVTSEANAQKIREQLEAVMKVLNHNQQLVAELDMKREKMRSQILEKERKTLKTANDITECQEKLLLVTKSLKSHLQSVNNSGKGQPDSTKLTSSNLKLKQLRNKRKLDPDATSGHVAKKQMISIKGDASSAVGVVSKSPKQTDDIKATSSLASADAAICSKGAAVVSAVDIDLSAMTTTTGTESKRDDPGLKNASPLRTGKETNVTSKHLNKQMNHVNVDDEKFSRLKDAHRKSTLRNQQFLPTSSTRLVFPFCKNATKQLNFSSWLASLHRAKPSRVQSGIGNLFEDCESGTGNYLKMNFLSGFLKSVRSFRAEKEFANPTYTNKIENDIPICQFEILGKCNDDKCPWQHERNYLMTPREILMEIVSYHPCVVSGLDERTPLAKYKSMIGNYVDDFMSKSKQTDIEKLYLMMLYRVSQAKGSAIFTPLNRNRLWSVRQEKILGKGKMSSSNSEDWTPFSMDSLAHLDDEDSLTGFDHRYWMTKKANGDASSDVQESDGDAECDGSPENHQTHEPRCLDEETFLTKAYSILSTETKSKSGPKIDVVLKVLAKGIEHHPRSVLLWQHYLKIFSQLRNRAAKRSHGAPSNAVAKETSEGGKEGRRSGSDVSAQLRQAFRQALDMVPSFELHWQYIQISESFSSKIESCSLALEYLSSDKVKAVEKEMRSHWILEVIMHKAQICFQTGKYAMGMDLIEDCLNCRDVYGLLTLLTNSDRVLLWMSFVHLSIFHSLPPNLFSGVNDNITPIVNKAPFSIFNHHLSVFTKQSASSASEDKCAKIISWYDKAIESCLSYCFESPPQGFLVLIKEAEDFFNARGRDEKFTDTLVCLDNEKEKDEYTWAWMSRLFISKAILLHEFKRDKDAISFLKAALNLLPVDIQDTRIFLLHLLSNFNNSSATDADSCSDFNEESKCVQTSLSAKFTYHVAKLLVSKDQSEEALQLLENLPIRIHNSDSGKEDPNILYCKLLDLELPDGFIPPGYSRDFQRESLNKERVYFWLCYCLLLDLQGDYDSTDDVYCKAVCKMQNSAELEEIWLTRLERLLPLEGTPSSEVQAEFFGLVDRALTELPVKLRLPLCESGARTYDSYCVHNSIVNFCRQRMASIECLTGFYDWTLSAIPGNAQLAVEAINHFIRCGKRSVAKGFTIMCLQEAPRSLALWKTSLKLFLLEGNMEQVRADYKKSLENLPFQKKLWNDFMLFEMVNKREEDLNHIVERCRQLGVNIVDLFKMLSSR